ncbi:MAG: tRNA (guanosine(37)-N1)-methyltransferase TrmD [Desulfitobacteriaceae bacterium]
MRFVVFTLFPEMFSALQESILRRAQNSGLIEIELINFRDYATSKHKNVDDIPYGGGAGMVLKPEPLFAAVKDLPKPSGERKIILVSPQGRVFRQEVAQELSLMSELVFICGHYEGFDERIRELADEEISVGDYVLTGGELAAAVIIDTVARLVPGVLGQSGSLEEESHGTGILEYPQYTRPVDFEGRQVPGVLLSGHHAHIARWRRKEALRRTFLRRPDLLTSFSFVPSDYPILEELAVEHLEIARWRERWQHLTPLPKRRGRKSPESQGIGPFRKPEDLE